MAWPRVDERQWSIVAGSQRKTTTRDGAPPGAGRWLELGDSGKCRGGDGTTLGWLGRWWEACTVLIDGEHNGAASGAVAGERVEWWVGRGGREIGMGFSSCADTRDKVVAHVGQRRVAVWQLGNTRGVTMTLGVSHVATALIGSEDIEVAAETTTRRRQSWSTTSSIPTCSYVGSLLELFFHCSAHLVVMIHDLLLASILR
jgi:hypothetical protein